MCTFEGMIRSEVCFSCATTVALVASGATNSVQFEPAVNIAPGLWSWTEGLDCVIVGGYDSRKSVSDYGSSIDRNISDTSVLLQDCKFYHKESRRRGDVICRRALRWMRSRAYHPAGCTRSTCKRRLVPRIDEALPDHLLFNDRAPAPAVLAGFSVVPLIAEVDRGGRRALPKHPTTDCFQ